MSHSFQLSKGLGGALIVGGTAIGAGMLALPVSTALGGFVPAIVMYLICWLFSVATGMLFLEICVWMPKGANIITMARTLLGPIGSFFAWLLYLFLFYTLTIAYVDLGGEAVQAVFGMWLPERAGIFLFTLFFAIFVYVGARAVDKVNLFLMVGLVASYFAFLAIGIREIDLSKLAQKNWTASLFALPVLFGSFGYQGTLPTLYEYLERNVKLVRFAIVIGTAIPFVIYSIWEILILGIIPVEGSYGLEWALTNGKSAVEPLRHLFPNSDIFLIGQFFSFFALTTSFLGVSLGLTDFLADGLRIEKTRIKKLWLCIGVFLPAAMVASYNPDIFIVALGYAGGIGCALLLGLYPIIMVWVGRYYKHKEGVAPQLGGGRGMLILLAAFVVFELIIQVLSQIRV